MVTDSKQDTKDKFSRGDITLEQALDILLNTWWLNGYDAMRFLMLKLNNNG